MPTTTKLSADRPFPGLRPFEYEDRHYFCGREEQSLALFNLLDLSRFVAVVGSSGSGKSSLVNAGLLSLLEQETLETEGREREDGGAGGRKWRWVRFRPGNAPVSQLAVQLAELDGSPEESAVEWAARRERLDTTLRRTSNGLSEALSTLDAAAESSLLIVVDQFEELFRYSVTGPARARLQEERDQFVQLLLTATGGYDHDLHVMITMRSDFIGDCSQFHGLPEAVSEAQFLVPSLTRLQREEVIRRPLDEDHANASIEPALVEQLLNDVADEDDQLPVLQHCLSRLWDMAGPSSATPPHRHLTRRHYEMVGGVDDALSRHADEILQELAGYEIAVEQVFRALSEEDDEGRATRRALPYAQLRAETGIGDAELRRVVDRFRADDCSFLMPSLSAQPELDDETTVDIGHEALLRRWRKIGGEAHHGPDADGEAGWLDAEANDGRDYRMMLRLISTDPDATLPLNRIDELLKRWRERPRTEAWAERYGGHLEQVERLFRNTLAAKRRQRWTRAAVTGVIAALAVGGFAAVYALYDTQAELTQKARQERLVLMREMTEMTQDVAMQLRYVPGTNHAIKAMLNDVRDFSGNFGQLLNEHYPGGLNKSDKIVQKLLSKRADLMKYNYDINFGEIGKAVENMRRLEKSLSEFPTIDGRKPLPVTMLHADILLHRAQGEQTYGNLERAGNDYAKAEKIYQSIVNSSHAEVSTADGMAPTDLSYTEEAKQRLARLYRHRSFFYLQYRNDPASAKEDLNAYTNLVKTQKDAESKGTDATNYWGKQELHIKRLKAHLLVAEKKFSDAIVEYESLLSRDGMSMALTAYLKYKKALAHLGRQDGNDIYQAITNLESASSDFAKLKDRDPENMWWKLVHGWVTYGLGRAYEANADISNARQAYRKAQKINENFTANDSNNMRAKGELERIDQALAQLEPGG